MPTRNNEDRIIISVEPEVDSKLTKKAVNDLSSMYKRMEELEKSLSKTRNANRAKEFLEYELLRKTIITIGNQAKLLGVSLDNAGKQGAASFSKTTKTIESSLNVTKRLIGATKQLSTAELLLQRNAKNLFILDQKVHTSKVIATAKQKIIQDKFEAGQAKLHERKLARQRAERSGFRKMLNNSRAALNLTNERIAREERFNDVIRKRSGISTKTASSRRASTAAGSGTGNGKEGFFGTMFEGAGTSFGHKVATTAQYATAGAGIYAVATALRSVIEASVDYDNALFNTIAVLQTSRVESEKLLESNRELAVEYGLSVKEIDDASIVLGRAGVAMSELAEATKVTAQLSKITGDSMEDSSKVVSSFTMAFNLASNQVAELGNQLAYAANASKLSIQDLGTMSNYALASAKALGLTKEEVLAIATGFSNVGINASTIGTQIRKFGKLVRDESKSSVKFFQDMGIE